MARGRTSNFYVHGYFGGFAEYRHGSPDPQPIQLPGQKPEKPIYSIGKRKHLIAQVVEAMSTWRSSPFEKEAGLVQGIRSQLCLLGHGWRRSDAEARFLVAQAIKAMGVPRPSWNEGQLTYVSSPDRCAWCSKEVDDIGNGKASRYCSPICAKSARAAMSNIIQDGYDKAYAAAERMIQKSKQKARSCAYCSAAFQPIREKSRQRFCSFSCGSKGAARTKPIGNLYSVTVEIACVYCGSDFEARHRAAITCSKRCNQAWAKLKTGREPQLLKVHVFDRYVTSQVNRSTLTPGKLDWFFMEAGRTITGEATVPRVTDRLFA